MLTLVLVSVIDMVTVVFTHEIFSSLCKFYSKNGDGIAVLLMSQCQNVLSEHLRAMVPSEAPNCHVKHA
jgi:hypothetical protein